ncbi:MAG: TolC family protein [Limnochordia bacterium]|jgi:outer membrane protein
MPRKLSINLLTFMLILLLALPAWGKTLTLEESVALALEQGPAGRMLQRAKKLELAGPQGKAITLRPQLKLSGGANWGERPVEWNPLYAIGGMEPPESPLSFNQQEISVDFHKAVWMTPALRALKEGIHWETELAELSEQKGQADLIYQVIEAYVGLLRARQMVTLAEEGLHIAQWKMDTVQEQYEAGVATIAEVITAEADLAEARMNKLATDDMLKTAQMGFNTLVGLPADSLVEPVDLADPLQRVPTLEEAMALAARQRPGLRRAQVELELAQLEVLAAQEEGRPVVSLIGQYEWKDITAGGSLSSNGYFGASSTYSRLDTGAGTGDDDDDDSSWVLGVNIQIPLLDGGGAKLRRDVADDGVQLAQLALELEEAQTELELFTLWAAVERAQAQLELADTRVKEMKERLRTIRELRAVQMATELDVAQLELAALQAQISRANARYDLHLAQAAYLKGIGSPQLLVERIR